jgi:hypothetical protein
MLILKIPQLTNLSVSRTSLDNFCKLFNKHKTARRLLYGIRNELLRMMKIAISVPDPMRKFFRWNGSKDLT